MVKPQSSKLITRVRFPSSPPLKGSGASAGAFFYIPGMKGIAYACGFDSSRARNPHAPARYPLTAHPHNTPYKTKGDRGVRAQWK